MPETPNRVLNNWKEIANYLGISVRAAQEWEKTRGLPVRRHEDANKSRVYCLRSELEQWLSDGPTAQVPKRPRWRGYWPAAAFLAVVVFGIGIAWQTRQPSLIGAEIEGATLRAFDKRQRVRWTRELADFAPDDSCTMNQDFDRDGRRDVVLVEAPGDCPAIRRSRCSKARSNHEREYINGNFDHDLDSEREHLRRVETFETAVDTNKLK